MKHIPELLDRAQDAFDDATLLIDNDRSEGAVNRLYFSTFYCIQALLESQDCYPNSFSQTHKRFSEYFILTGKFDRTISRSVKELFKNKQSADYGKGYFSDELVRTSKSKAEGILTLTKKYFADGKEIS